MIKRYLKRAGARKKALFGADGAIAAAGTIAAAGIMAAATNAAAKTQSNAVVQNAKTQAASIKQQSDNNTALQKESIEFTRAQNQETRDQQQDIQMTLQMLAGQQNMNDRMEKNKVAVKFGGRPKRHLRNANAFYGGANTPFIVIDGGGAIPLNVDNNGYGLYELYGNDHEHYHKTSRGKSKTGVGIKFPDGSVVEGEGNQNTSSGEKLFVTPTDALFISKHSIDGFNPAKAVDAGMSPMDAFNTQEAIKANKGYNDDGTKTRRRLRSAAAIGAGLILDNANQTVKPYIGTDVMSGGVTYAVNSNTPPVEESINKNNKPALKHGGRVKAEGGYWSNYGGATMNAAGNVAGAGINVLGNYFANKTLRKGYAQAANILADAYSKMHGIDMSEISREDYAAPHAMAVVRSADTNINPQIERLRRNANAEQENVNRNTLSSAARQQRLAGINDRMYQRMTEAYATKHNQDEQIKQGNAERISQTSQFNAQQDLNASQNYNNARLNLLRYNNDIENSKIAGIAQARADATTSIADAKSNFITSSAQSIGNAISTSAQGFANAHSNVQAQKYADNIAYMGADNDSKYQMLMNGDKTSHANYERAAALISSLTQQNTEAAIAKAKALGKEYGIEVKIDMYSPKIQNDNSNDFYDYVPSARINNNFYA